jgi:DNA repair exonuclease SbcCD ATPase subunit
MKEKEL